MPQKDWDPEEVKSIIYAEMDYSEQDEESITRTKLIKATPLAAEQIIWMAQWSQSEAMRFKASRYILDRVLGRPTDEPMADDTDDVLKKLIDGVVDVN